MRKERANRIQHMRSIAGQFRFQARQTAQPGYIRLLSSAARDLEESADLLEFGVLKRARGAGSPGTRMTEIDEHPALAFALQQREHPSMRGA